MAQEPERLVIVGTGEVARLADQYFTHDSNYRVVGFAAERGHLPGDTFDGRPAVPLEALPTRYPPDSHHAFVATSPRDVNALRKRLYFDVKTMGYTCATYVHSGAAVWSPEALGENCLVGELNVIQPFAAIGDNVFLHSANVVGHRTVVEDHCFVSAHVAIGAFCRIGASSFLGLNCTFNDRTGVSHECIVASGALVAKDLTMSGRVYQGSPAMALEGLQSSDVEL